jgi:serine/threonine-protein kinase
VSLVTGSRIGAYRILTQIGSGGMGEVYRATDTNLGRDVAIKILPEPMASDPERTARFEREARTLAALNHSHIAHIHGFEEHDGVRLLVMELVEGPTLADRLAHGPIRIEEACAIAQQIAEGLECAHDLGIIHRDLKPANVKVRPDGTVKLLDFGLAKAFAPRSDSVPEEAMSSTRSAFGTRTGIVVGTAAYMSPEQACGKPVDKRADIWAFGCVLFEMLARCRPFPGETTTEVIAATLEREPDFTKLPAATPQSVRRLLARCLEKNPARRLRDIGDARLDLEDALTGERADATGSARRRTRVASVAGAIAVALLLGVVATAASFRMLSSAPRPSHPVTRFAIPFGPNEFVGSLHSPQVTISNDGSKVVYAVNAGSTQGALIRVRWSDQDQPKVLPDVFGQAPFLSPDGKWVGYWYGQTRTLRKAALSGGAPVVLTDVDSISGATWGEDGNIVWAWFNLFSIPASGGSPKTLLSVDIGKGERFFRQPQYLPGGKAILFAIGTGDIEGYEDARIAVTA